MKALILPLLLLAGCATPGNDASKIQRFLDAALPPSFVGRAVVEHKNAYFDFTIEADGLRRQDGRWQWDSLRYLRNGRLSQGRITLAKDPESR